ncbi:MAG: pitrilysin family protein [candidate division Zixibacteria bacterium]
MKKYHLAFQLLAILAILLGTAPSYGFDFSKLENSVVEHTLENGLKLIILERHDAPVVSFNTYADVGSVDDPKGYTGLAHMFEHMAFKGTTTFGTKDYKAEKELIEIEDSIFMELRAERTKGFWADSARIEQLEKDYEAAREASYEMVIPNQYGQTVSREGGVGLNAGTWTDRTVYFISLPSNKVELWMALESERFLNPVLREMYKERDVVAEERRMRTESSPIGRLIEQFLGLSFLAHPYGVPGIGHMSDIQYYSRKEATAFFEKYYSPANLTIAIVGDVNTKNLIKMAEKYWTRIPYRPKPARIATVEPEQKGERRMVIEDPSQPWYLAGWHIPELTHPDRPAIDALLDYLAIGRTSLLYKKLVKEKKMVQQASGLTGFPGEKYPGMILLYALPAPKVSNADCEAEILAEVERMKEELIPEDEVEKIKARAKAQFVNGLSRNSGMGFQLAAYQTYWGDWREMFNELNRINAVTAEDIKRVANTYLTSKNRTVIMMNTVES